MEGGSGNDVELISKTLQFEHKLFCLNLKENRRGKYLKISEKTSSTRSTIIVPVDGIEWFCKLFDYYISSSEHEENIAFSKELKLPTKVFYFDVGENKRGCFLKGYDKEHLMYHTHQTWKNLLSNSREHLLPGGNVVLLILFVIAVVILALNVSIRATYWEDTVAPSD